jgi:hypothetical protein
MSSSLPPEDIEPEQDDELYPSEYCPELYEPYEYDDEELYEDDEDIDELEPEDGYGRSLGLDEHQAMTSYSFVPREEQQRLWNKYKRIRGRLSEEFCEMQDIMRNRIRRRRRRDDE